MFGHGEKQVQDVAQAGWSKKTVNLASVTYSRVAPACVDEYTGFPLACQRPYGGGFPPLEQNFIGLKLLRTILKCIQPSVFAAFRLEGTDC